MNKQTCRILALDGGGVHVLGQAIMLGRIFEKYPELFSQIDVFTGTSAGALLAMTLAEKGPAGLAMFNPSHINTMFQRSYSFKIWPSEGLFGAKYTNVAMSHFLTQTFDGLTISEMKRQVYVPAFKLSTDPAVHGDPPGRWHPEFFTNIGVDASTDLVSDVALRTTAAPTYFPIYQNYCDGGVFANNPAAAAVSHCKRTGYAMENIRVMSLSGGTKPGCITDENAKWGIIEWISSIVNMLMESSVYATDDLCKELLGDSYCRYELPLKQDIPLDGLDQLTELAEAANEADLTPVFDWIDQHWNQ